MLHHALMGAVVQVPSANKAILRIFFFAGHRLFAEYEPQHQKYWCSIRDMKE
jgi:hypothetical protein